MHKKAAKVFGIDIMHALKPYNEVLCSWPFNSCLLLCFCKQVFSRLHFRALPHTSVSIAWKKAGKLRHNEMRGSWPYRKQGSIHRPELWSHLSTQCLPQTFLDFLTTEGCRSLLSPPMAFFSHYAFPLPQQEKCVEGIEVSK